MESSSVKNVSFRHEISNRLNRFRRKLQRGPDISSSRSPHVTNAASSSVHRSTTQSPASTNHAIHTRASQDSAFADPTVTSAQDLWSAAYREAVESLGKDIDVAILKGGSAAQLFRQLEEMDKNAYQESAFHRGVKALQSVQVPLEKFKLALDLASPLSSLEPTATTVIGVVRCITAIAITFASADANFAKQIGEMLQQLQYIDQCDILGQRSNRQDIHKALVPIYRKVLEFYQAAYEILTRKGARLVLKMVLETDRIPGIIQDFLTLAAALQRLIEQATLEVVEDIKKMVYENDIDRWLGGDKAVEQGRRHTYLQMLRADDACVPLLEDPSFRKWYDATDSRWLMILGDTGCGKSVTMSFAVDELCRRSEHQLPQPKICYHYCRNDETGLDYYVFSVMILSLLQQLNGLKRLFHEWYRDKLSAGARPATSPRQLGEFLEKVVKALDRPLFIVIDGLDECGWSSLEEILKLLRTLSQKNPRLKILLSSRPEIRVLEHVGPVPQLHLTPNKQRDTIVVRYLVEKQLSSLAEDVKALVIERLSHLAQGSAIWVSMTIKSIQDDGITERGLMSDFLGELSLPGELSALYHSMIARRSSGNPKNMEIIKTALKLLAVARRPLSVKEVTWAVTLATYRDKITTIDDLNRLADCKRVMSRIDGFVTHSNPDDLTMRQIGLVHHSLKEFVIEEWLPQHDSVHRRVQMLESFTLGICIDYLLLDEIGRIPLFSETQIAIHELPQDVDLFEETEPLDYDPLCSWEVWEENMTRYDPAERGFGQFFVYAASHWLQHFGAVPAGSLPELMKVEVLCEAGSIRLDNWINQNCRPDCVIKARFEFDSRLYDPLSITSLYGSDAVLYNMLEHSDFESARFLPFPAIAAANQILQFGNLSRLRSLFLEHKLNRQLRSFEFFRLLIDRWSDVGARQPNWDVAFDLVNLILDTLVEEQWGSDLLCIAAGKGCMPLIKTLLNGTQHQPGLEAELTRDPQPIIDAILKNHAEVVGYLLKYPAFETHLTRLNSCGESVLHVASDVCNPIILRLLTPYFQKHAYQVDGQGRTALMRAITSRVGSHDRYESAGILLSLQGSGGTICHSANVRGDPLRLAVESGDIQMCEMLICDGGYDPRPALLHDSDGELVLKDKPQANGAAILQLLRNHSKAEVAISSGTVSSLPTNCDAQARKPDLTTASQ